MIKMNMALLLPVLLLLAITGIADVPPEADYVRVRNNLVIETKEDLTDFRFFIDFYGDLKEIEIKSKARTTIPPMGGGARYSSGTLFAIPVKSLSGFAGKLTPEQLKNLSQSIKNKKIEGVQELFIHRFSQDNPKDQAKEDFYYTITRIGQNLVAEILPEGWPKLNKEKELIPQPNRSNIIIGGILLTIAALIVGLFIFRNVSKKSKMNL